jgi:hypothetical protein
MPTQARLFAYLGASIVAVLIVSGGAVAQESSRAPGSSSAPSDRGAVPGAEIKVHGHWTIDVHNPDGTLSSHNEFENALLPSGASLLAGMLGRSQTPRSWRIGLQYESNGPCNRGGVHVPCYAVEPGAAVPPNSEDYYFPTLAFRQIESVPGSGLFDALELTGNVTASFPDQIQLVSTTLSTNVGGDFFSSRFLAQTIQVAVGQKVYVKVVLSFS